MLNLSHSCIHRTTILVRRTACFAYSPDVVSELKKLNRALIFSFLELLEVLVKNPALYQKKVDDLEVIFVNMHHLLNSFRPHQARSYIISVLEEQVTKKKSAVASLRSTFAHVETTMRQLSEQIEKEATLPVVAARAEASAMEVRYTAVHSIVLKTKRSMQQSLQLQRSRLLPRLSKQHWLR
jgi:hypothetical protein